MSDDIVVNMNFNLGKDQTVADIVTLLRKYQPYSKLHGQAADEIERLRKLAYLLIDELRFNGGYEAYTSKMLFDEFYEQAVRGD